MGRKKETVRSLAMACSLLTSCFLLACQRAVLSALAGYNAETEDEERFPRTILTYLLMDMLMDFKMQLNEKHRLGLFELLILPSPFTVPIHPVLLKIFHRSEKASKPANCSFEYELAYMLALISLFRIGGSGGSRISIWRKL